MPYGFSNFADLIGSGYAYVDKTRYLGLLEAENNRYQFLIRPRRFGKSLFLSVLENYYDARGKGRFESIFAGLDICERPTPERGMYAVMGFDFSGLDTDSREGFRRSFTDRVQNAVRAFLSRYRGYFPNAEADIRRLNETDPGIGALETAYNSVADAGIPIFAIIDEYDHFANNLIATGKAYGGEVEAGGIVRSFYELLKAGTKSAVRRIFITGISPMMINDLTSGFNILTDYTLDQKYNEMFGFTAEEVRWLMKETGVDENLIKIDMEVCYNGYMFNGDGKDKVYNSQMVLYLFDKILTTGKQPSEIVDANLQTDCARLRRLAENENNRGSLLRITKDGGIFGRIIERFSLEKLEAEEYFVSLLFYLGMLTHGEMKMGRTWLKIPNYSIRTLYWEYAVSYVLNQEKKTMATAELSETISKMAFDGDITPYLDFFTENFLKRISNRDLMNFDEKYIKVMLLSTLFLSRMYLPVSESENINGYTDIYLLRHPAMPDIKFEYVFEVKYIKAEASAGERTAKFAEAFAQIRRYKKDPRFAGRGDIKFAALVFEGKGSYEAKNAD